MAPTKLSGIEILISCIDRGLAVSTKDLLYIHGYDSCIASGKNDVEHHLRQVCFDFIIVDLDIIEADKPSLMEWIKFKQSSSNLIVLSSDPTYEKAVWALRHGADDFFKTPYDPCELVSSVNRLTNKNIEKKRKGREQNRSYNSEILHRFIVDNSPDMIYLLDQKGQFTFFNDQIKKILGFTRKELLGKHYTTLICSEDQEKSRYVFNERRTGKRAAKNIELRLQQKNNQPISLSSDRPVINIELNATGIYKKDKDKQARIFLGTYGIVRDISKRKLKENQFRHQLYHDILTNLPNRSLFQDRLRLALPQAKRNGQALAVMFLDIDGFKKINDSYGHACGDMLLQNFSARLKSCLREGDTLARISGDEFTILIPQVTSRKNTRKIAKKILNEFSIPFKMQHIEIVIGVSIGIALYPIDGDSDEELLQKADWAMYHVKKNGKNGFVHYRYNIHKPCSSNVNFIAEPGSTTISF